MEDLDNRGRCPNLRIRGMPESIELEQLSPTVVSLFNDLVNRPLQSQIAMERIHRAFRPKGEEADPPRDIICCIVDYKLKEEILKQARSKAQALHAGAHIQIFQDLSSITLQHRRDLKPLLDTLRTKRIPYRWKFPFCLSDTTQGRTALPKVPEDMPQLCNTLGIPLIDVPNWYAEFCHTVASQPMDAQDTQYRRRRSPSGTQNHTVIPSYRHDASLTDSPRARRARRDR